MTEELDNTTFTLLMVKPEDYNKDLALLATQNAETNLSAGEVCESLERVGAESMGEMIENEDFIKTNTQFEDMRIYIWKE